LNKSIALLLLLFSSVFALPEGEKVISGEGSFVSENPHSVTITASDKAIINYQSFNISEGEKVAFIQPSQNACVLNRVIGKDLSKILGSLSSNGRVFLVNPRAFTSAPMPLSIQALLLHRL